MQLSVVVTVFNEHENIHPLVQQIHTALLGIDYEIVYVDDGSTDGTLERLYTLEDPRLTVVALRKNYGQSAALMAGIEAAGGTATVRDLNRQFDWKLPDDEAATIAGLVIHEAQQIPDVGQTFTFYGFRFEVVAREGHQVPQLRLVPPAT